jgi:hypothetical protein
MKSILCFFWGTAWPQILMACLFVLIGIYWFCKDKQWPGGVSDLITIATLVLAIFIWFNEKRQEWRNSLPKRLDVHYKVKDEEYVTVRNAPLTGVSDIRPWGQSIGKTVLNGGKNIDFTSFKIEGPKYDKVLMIMQYTLHIYLEKEFENPCEEEYRYCNEGKLIRPEVIEPEARDNV